MTNILNFPSHARLLFLAATLMAISQFSICGGTDQGGGQTGSALPAPPTIAPDRQGAPNSGPKAGAPRVARPQQPVPVVHRVTKFDARFDVGFKGNFDWREKGVDARGFEEHNLGIDGDYFLPQTLKPAVLNQGREDLQWIFAFKHLTKAALAKDHLVKRMTETFGDERLTAGRMASLEVAVSVTPLAAQPGAVAFHRDYLFNMARSLSEWEKVVAKGVWLANYSADEPPDKNTPLQASALKIVDVSPIRQALRQGCVADDEAANAWLSNLLSGTNVKAGNARLEISQVTPGAIHLHLPPDLANAQTVAQTISRKNVVILLYAERDADNNVTGASLFLHEGFPFANYVNSYYHGELCGKR